MKKAATISFLVLMLLAFALRIAHVTYGLPLWLINDEASMVLGALKMMELKSAIPAHHLGEMSAVLYYPPYVSYLYIIPFSIVLFFQNLYHAVDFEALKIIVTSDLSAYFIVARIISIAAGLLSIFFMYKASLSIFKTSRAALFSALLGATSLIHISLSMSARHWIFISLVYSAALYVLSHESLQAKKKYLLYYLIAAIGMGVSSISIVLFMLPPLWFLFEEKQPFAKIFALFKSWKFCLQAVAVGFLSLLPSLLYPLSNGFLVDVTSNTTKSLLQAFASPLSMISRIGIAEPFLIIFMLVGFYFLFKKKPRVGLIFIAFISAYSIVFYFMFRFEARFVLPLIPFILIVAGYGIDILWQKNKLFKGITALILIVILAGSIKLAYLGHNDDSRIHAVEWAYENLNESDKVMTYGSQLRLPATKSAIEELRKADQNAVRKIDLSEELRETDAFRRFQSLNVYTIQNEDFLKNIQTYAVSNGYTYVIREKSGSKIGKAMENLTSESWKLVASFGEPSTPYSLATSEFMGSILGLFKAKELGPEIEIYKAVK